MLVLFVDYLMSLWHIPGIRLLKYVTSRSAFVAVLAIIIAIYGCKKIIIYFNKRGIKDEVRGLNLPGQFQKNVPSMGGIVIVVSTIILTVLFADITNIYIDILLITTIMMGILGFCDDYIKLYKHNKNGLSAKTRLLVQTILGSIIGIIMVFHPDVYVKKKTYIDNSKTIETNKLVTSVPFFKNNEIKYCKIFSFAGRWYIVLFILLMTFIIVGTSNAVNLTDGLDGLAVGLSIIVLAVLCVFAYISGHYDIATYLNIFYIPNFSEVSIFCSALIASCIGFLWYNSYPAQIFMGDTGSLVLGGNISVLAIITRKELLLPLLCGVFVIETLSDILQVAYFKYTKKKYGAGRRIFLMAPIHHHFQKMNIQEPKIVARFLIVGIVLGIITLATVKIQ